MMLTEIDQILGRGMIRRSLTQGCGWSKKPGPERLRYSLINKL